MPLVVFWPGIGEAGASSDSLGDGADFYTSFLDMSGTPRQPAKHLDSISFARTAVGSGNRPRQENCHWFTNADTGTGQLTYQVSDSHGATAEGVSTVTSLADLTVVPPPVFDLTPEKSLVDAWEFNEASGTQI